MRKILIPLILLPLTSCFVGSEDMVTISAAASLTDAIVEVVESYPVEKMPRSQINFVSSSTGARQIKNGQDVSLFISANEEWVDFLQGKYIEGTKKSLLANQLVLAIRNDSELEVNDPADLTEDYVKRIAMGDPGHVPAGMYGKEALEHLGLWNKIEAKVVGAMDVRAAMGLLSNSSVDCAIVYGSDLLIDDSLKPAYLFPEEETNPIEYFICLFAADSESREFYDYLFSEEAQSIFARHGFSKGAGL